MVRGAGWAAIIVVALGACSVSVDDECRQDTDCGEGRLCLPSAQVCVEQVSVGTAAWRRDGLGADVTVELLLPTALRTGGHVELLIVDALDGRGRRAMVPGGSPVGFGGLWVDRPYHLVVRAWHGEASGAADRVGVLQLTPWRPGIHQIPTGRPDCVERVTGTGFGARTGATFTALPDGRVLALGGHLGATLSDRIEVWDPRTGQALELAARLPEPRSGHTATALADGRVVVFGGVSPGPDGLTASREGLVLELEGRDVYLTHQFAAPPGFGRTLHTATRLHDDSVIFVGGVNLDAQLRRSVFRYHPDPAGVGGRLVR